MSVGSQWISRDRPFPTKLGPIPIGRMINSWSTSSYPTPISISPLYKTTYHLDEFVFIYYQVVLEGWRPSPSSADHAKLAIVVHPEVHSAGIYKGTFFTFLLFLLLLFLFFLVFPLSQVNRLTFCRHSFLGGKKGETAVDRGIWGVYTGFSCEAVFGCTITMLRLISPSRGWNWPESSFWQSCKAPTEERVSCTRYLPSIFHESPSFCHSPCTWRTSSPFGSRISQISFSICSSPSCYKV